MFGGVDLSLTSKLNVFISSKDFLDDERLTVAQAISDLGMNPILSQSHYWVATSDDKEYLRQVQIANVVILLLEANPEIPTEMSEETYYHYVLNEIDIALEKGKAVLMFVKQKKWEKYPELLDSILQKMQSYVFPRTFNSCVDLRSAVLSALLSELFDSYIQEPEVLESSHNLYRSATDLINRANQRIYLSQKTPTILFGPRLNSREERLFFDACKAWIESAVTSDNKEFVILYNIDDVMKEMRENLSQYNVAMIRDNLKFLRDKLGESLKIVPVNQPLIKFAVFDHKMSLWLRLGQKVFGIAAQQHATCDVLIRMSHDIVQSQPISSRDHITQLLDHLDNVTRTIQIRSHDSEKRQSSATNFIDRADDLHREIILLRKSFVEELHTVSVKSVSEQVVFLRHTRCQIYKDCIGIELSLPSNYEQYFELSDRATASFGLSLDRAHGEHHKLDVIYFGLKLMNYFWNEVRAELPRLLLLILNEHDEGRRVAYDGNHERKGAELVRSRMMEIGGFLHQDIEKCVNAIGNHAFISVGKRHRSRPEDREEALLDDTLIVADCLSLLDPSRTIAHAVKHNITMENYYNNWRSRRNFMFEQIEKTIYADLCGHIEQAMQITEKVISQFMPLSEEEMKESAKRGDDIKAYCELFGEPPYLHLPIYGYSY